MGELHGDLLGAIKSCSNILLISVLAASLFKSGSLRGACFIGERGGGVGGFAVLIRCSMRLQRPTFPLYLENASVYFTSNELSASASASDNRVFDDSKRSLR